MVYGVSTDSEFVHLAWRQNHADLKDAAVPDARRHQARAVDARSASSTRRRASRCAPPSSSIPRASSASSSVNDLSVGRNPQEVLRVLDALQTDELCPCNWQKGDDVLKAA